MIKPDLKALSDAATQGEWQANGSHVYGPDPDRNLILQMRSNYGALVPDRDFVTALVNLFRSGDLVQPAPEREAVGITSEMPGSNGGFSMAVFASSDVPVGTPLYRDPAPVVDVGAVKMLIEALALELARLRALVRGECPSLLDDADGGTIPDIDGENALRQWSAALTAMENTDGQ